MALDTILLTSGNLGDESWMHGRQSSKRLGSFLNIFLLHFFFRDSIAAWCFVSKGRWWARSLTDSNSFVSWRYSALSSPLQCLRHSYHLHGHLWQYSTEQSQRFSRRYLDGRATIAREFDFLFVFLLSRYANVHHQLVKTGIDSGQRFLPSSPSVDDNASSRLDVTDNWWCQ